MPYPCPYCGTVGTYRNNLRTHLMGTTPYGGHGLSRAEADAIILGIESGRGTTPRPHALGEPRVATSESPGTTRISSPALREGHWRVLRQLEDDISFQTTRDLYERLLGHCGVYFRPTDKGLTVISLDYERCSAMIGVGGRDSEEVYLTSLPPSREAVQTAYKGYIQKRDSLRRQSPEECFALRCIRHALMHGLKLPQGDWYSLHQEWRFPTDTSGGKLDIVAANGHSGELAVIELKDSEAKTRIADKNGRKAQVQAAYYASLLHTYRNTLYPFFERLAHVWAKHYQGPPEIKELHIPAEHTPHALVWWP